MKTKRPTSISTTATSTRQKTVAVLSKDKLSHRWCEIKSQFNDMSESKRVDELRKFWEMDYIVTELDPKTGCIYSSSPLQRVFTICHDELAQGYLEFRGERLSTQEEIGAAVQDVKNSIESTVRRFKGYVTDSERAELGYECLKVATSCFYGFQKGFGSDDFLLGMFFSEAGRAKAIKMIGKEWGQYGVRTEPVGSEKDVHAERISLWNSGFDRKDFRKQFAKLSHAKRLKAIEELSTKGIKFRYTDPKTKHVYNTRLIPFGVEKCSREFSYDFTLGYSKENIPSATEIWSQVDRVERSLLGTIAKHNGFVINIERDLIFASHACMRLQDSEEVFGDGHVYAKFPNKAARRRASEEVFDTLAVHGVRFSLEERETPSVGERVASVRQARDSIRKQLDSRWGSLNSRKDEHRQEKIKLVKEEAELLQQEIGFKEFDCEISERLEQLSGERTDFSDGKSMSEEQQVTSQTRS